MFILILLLSLLASTADSYFCVVMDSIVEKLNIPPSIAGVTFLAFGNGAPDVFSLIMSVLGGMTEIGVGANMGAGMFITSVVAGCVSVFSNCEINKASFLRDILFYFVAVIYLIVVFFDKKIKLWEAIGFLLLYAVYITVSSLSPSPPDRPLPPQEAAGPRSAHRLSSSRSSRRRVSSTRWRPTRRRSFSRPAVLPPTASRAPACRSV